MQIKNTFIATCLIMGIIATGFAQSGKHVGTNNDNNLKGPKAKNTPVHERQKGTQIPVYTSQGDKVYGPAYKNRKPGADVTADKQKVKRSKKTRLTGPKAKNRKAWE